ncbi:MAG: delta-60 repeat domain-containing protein, partial [Bacteroidota bacterium]|nr:delta-60 repeat domain-containing protein [Bacteroidota bacterium]
MKKLIYLPLYLFMFTSFLLSQSSIPNNKYVTDGTVRAIVVDGDYTYIGGDFTSVGIKANFTSFAKFNSANSNIDVNFPIVVGDVETSAPDGNGGWYIGGSFNSVGGQPRNYIARINSDGTVHPWNPNPGIGFYNVVSSIAVSGNDIYAGGRFSTIGGLTRSNIAKLNNTNGNADATWNPNATGFVYSIVVSGSDVYVGGEFTT